MTPTRAPAKPAAVTRRLVQMCAYVVITGILLFGSAGTLKWLYAWVWLLFTAGFQIAATLIIGARHPDLMEERSRIREGTKWWDRILVPLLMLSTLAIFVTAGLDFRFHGAKPPVWLAVIAVAVVDAGALLTTQAMLANRFFATSVRIQTERGHRVVSAGPYAYVRHPGYAGALLFTAMAPLALGSRLAAIAAGLTIAVIVLRTALEDRTLQRELLGYREYAERVRSRLIPGIW